MLLSAESTFVTFLADAFAVFVFILWFWLFITTASDLFRRSDVSGLGKVLWVILLIVLPYIGIFAYILTQGGGMAERNRMQARQARDELRQIVGFSAADELAKLERLKAENAISDPEYARLRARVVQ
ncbi:MAG: PLDc N-terminal domain-containing protein [Reyranellaceae bacterium]